MNTLSSLLKNLRNRTPVGTVEMFAGASAPTDWLVCDGSAVSREDYSSLFNVIGTTYGSGDGSTTFNLPDMRGRTAVGVGNGDATGHTNHTLGQKSGNENAIVPYHKHSVSAFNTGGMSSNHNHTVYYLKGFAGGGGSSAVVHYAMSGSSATTSTEANQDHTHSVGAHDTNYEGSSVTGANMMPYLGINFIIYAGTTA